MLIFTACLFDPTGIGPTPIPDSATDTEGPISFPTTSNDPVTSSTTDNTVSSTTDFIPTTSTTIEITLTTDLSSTSLEELSSTSYETISSTSTSGFESTSSSSTSTTSIIEDLPNDKCGDRLIDPEEDCDWAAYQNTEYSLCISPELETDTDKACTLKLLKIPLLIKDMQLIGTSDTELNLEEGHIICKLMFKNPNSLAKSYSVYNGIPPGYSVISNINWQGSVLLKSHAEGYKGQPMYFYDVNNIPFNPQLGQTLHVSMGCMN